MSKSSFRTDPPVAYHVELDVDPWGAVRGGEDLLPVRSDDHDWFTAYPPVDTELVLHWAPGERRERPNVYWYPHIFAWVCDKRAFDLLKAVVPGDIHVIAQARLQDEPAWVVQIVGRLDGIVDEAASLIDRYPAYQIMQWPSFRRSAVDRMANRLFRVPEMYLDVFMGARVKAAFDEAGIAGLRFVAVDWTDDREWTADRPVDEQSAWQVAADLSVEATWPRGVPVGLAHVASLLRFDRSMREGGLLSVVARQDAGQIESASAAADYLGLADLAEAIRVTPQWTKSTVRELETRYRGVAGDPIREAFAQRFRAQVDDFR